MREDWLEGSILLVQLPGWRPMVWFGCAAVLALAPAPELTLALVLLRVLALGPVPVPVPELRARPLLGLFRPALLRWPVRSGGWWLVE